MHKLRCLREATSIDICDDVFRLMENETQTLFKRRSRLYVPLSAPAFIHRTSVTITDGFIFDLEDSVSQPQKAQARENVKQIPPKQPDVEYILRINSYETGLWEEDLTCLDLYPFDSIMIPKVGSSRHVEEITARLPETHLHRIILIETIPGLWQIREIASTLRAGDAMGYGAGDLSTALDIPRAPLHKSVFLQQVLVTVLTAAKMVDVDVFDPPYRHYRDMQGLRKEAQFGRNAGSTGKQAVHPSQVETINEVYSPTCTEVAGYAREIAEFANNPERQAISLDGEYRGKPSLALAKKKLIEYCRRGYVAVDV